MGKRRKSKIIKFRKLLGFHKKVSTSHAKNLIPNLTGINKPHSKAYVYESELSYLGKCILDFPTIETGGQLFGFWTASGAPVVVYAIGPGPKANHQVTFFNQDIEYLENIGRILVSHFGLMHIGEWHSHHRLGLDYPSGHDANTMQHSIDNLHLNRFLLCIGNCNDSSYSIKPYNFIENHSEYSSAFWEIKGSTSPYRSLIDTYLSNFSFQKSHEPKENNSWFSLKSNRVQLKSMMDFLKTKHGSIDSKAQLKDNIVEIITTFTDRNEIIIIPSDFPKKPISLFCHYYNGCEEEKRPNLSLIDCAGQDIFEVFKQQYNSIQL